MPSFSKPRCLLASLLAVCGALLPAWVMAKESLMLWHAYRGQERQALEQLLDQFNRQQTEIEVQSKAVPFFAYGDRLTNALPLGRGPDLFIYAQDLLGQWVARGQTVRPLDELISADQRQKFVPLTLEAMTLDGKLYGVPFDFKGIAMIYNRKLVKQPPQTTQELLALAQKFQQQGQGVYGLSYEYRDFYYHAAWVNGFGGGVFDADGKAVLNQPNNQRAYRYLLEHYVKAGLFPEYPLGETLTSLFNQHKVAVVFSGPWFLGDVAPEIDIGVSLLPQISEAEHRRLTPWLTVEGLFVSAKTAKTAAAMQLIEYLTSIESGLVMAQTGRQLPANQQLYQRPELRQDPVLSAFYQQAQHSQIMPNRWIMSRAWGPLTTSLNRSFHGTSSVEQALNAAQKAIEQSMSEK